MAISNNGRLILGGKFTFKSNSVIVCNICKCEFKYHRSTSSLTYHLHSQNPFSAGDQLMTFANCKPSQHQPTLMELKEKAKPMEQSKFDAVTIVIAKWIAMNGRPSNIVTVSSAGAKALAHYRAEPDKDFNRQS